jgi:UDPglucose 6-dehydrogenase
MRPDRIIIGSEDERATALLRELYAPFQRNHERMMLMGVRSASSPSTPPTRCWPPASRS